MLTTDLVDKLSKLLQYKNLSLATIEKISGMSRRSILNDIDQVNEAFSPYAIEVTLTEAEVLTLPDFDFEELMERIFSEEDFFFQQERPYMIVLYLFLQQDFSSVSHLQDLLKMSKNTILSDLHDANMFSLGFDVEINYSRQAGYKLAGDTLDIRTLIDRTITRLLNFSTGKWIIDYIAQSWNLNLNTEEIYRILDAVQDITFVNERLEGVVYLMAILDEGPTIEDKKIHLNKHELAYIKQSPISSLTDKIIERFPKLITQDSYITIQLLSVIQGRLETDRSPFFERILEEIILNVQGYIGSIFPNNRNFRRNLYNHLVPFYFRMKFHIQLDNPLKNKMLQEYPDLFYLLKRSFEPVAERLDIEVTDDEVAYFVMHFGSYFTNPRDSKATKLTAIIVCPQGVGTSILLKNLLSRVMPEVHFTKHASVSLSTDDLIDVNLIISTVYLESELPVYHVNPSLNQMELALLKRSIYEKFHIETSAMNRVNALYDRIKPYTEEKHALILKVEMDQVLDEDLKDNHTNLEPFEYSLLLTEPMIVQAKRVSDWREAIRLASQPLLELDYITEQYTESMIASVEKYGPYIVLAPHVAIPHAKPTDGSKKLGISLLQLKDAVRFEHPVKRTEVFANLIFVLSIVDNHSHLNLLKRIYSLAENESVISKVIEASDKKDILKIIETHFNEIKHL